MKGEKNPKENSSIYESSRVAFHYRGRIYL